jgi:4-hydroxy-4-methyl-2-oxoglutarate aldolase
MNTKEALDALYEFPIATLINAHERITAVGASVRPLFAGARVFGPARTAIIKPGQNAAIHRAVHAARAGETLVVSAGGDTHYGSFGDILAQACIDRGIAGLVIDGTIRDTADIVAMGFPVFCTGANPTGTSKADPGEIDREIRCGDARVRPGDFISGDEDGVIVIPREIVDGLAARCRSVMDKEGRIRQQLADGRTTCEIFRIEV